MMKIKDRWKYLTEKGITKVKEVLTLLQTEMNWFLNQLIVKACGWHVHTRGPELPQERDRDMVFVGCSYKIIIQWMGISAI